MWSMQGSWIVKPAGALQEKTSSLVRQLAYDSNSQLSQVARPSRQTTLFGKNWPFAFQTDILPDHSIWEKLTTLLFIYLFFTKVDVVMICKCFIIASSLTLIFYLSLLFWILKIASSLGIFLHLSFFLMDVGNHIVLDFNSLFVFVCISVRDHIVLDPHFSFVSYRCWKPHCPWHWFVVCLCSCILKMKK